MTATSAPETPRSHGYGWLLRSCIVTEGVLTVLAGFFVFPVGIALVLANAVAATMSSGRDRKLFAGVAIVGAAACLFVLLFAFGVSRTVEIGPATATSL